MQIICYDTSSLIKKKLVLKKCPSCHAELKSCEVDHSEASRMFCKKAAVPVISTHLSQCPDCGWWAVRELRSDEELYYAPVEAFMIVGAGKQETNSSSWKQVLSDEAYWKNPVLMQSTYVIELFGSAQMLLPSISSLSRQSVFDKVKSVAPILFPVLIIILIAVFF